MLNITNNSIDRDQILKDQSSYKEVMRSEASRKLVYIILGLILIGMVILFLPWTQNIRARGSLTTIEPEDREQDIHSMITGRIEKWYVREGQLATAGDTIVFISEVKAEYLDPELIARTNKQAETRLNSVGTYNSKANALQDQINALHRNQKLKLAQAQNYLQQSQLKMESDSVEFETAKIGLSIADAQFKRQEKLYEQGLKSLTELEQRRQKFQESINKKIARENAWMASKAAYINAQINLNTVENEFSEKIAKATSEKMSALSSALDAEVDYNKLSIQGSNYTQRSGFYYITAPQDGFVTRALIDGIGETVKEGEPVFSFIPKDYDLALEIFVRPIDLPLVREGGKIQIQFDGWPAIVFNGWPNLSFGTYTGVITAYDKAISPNGKFRVLVVPDPDDKPWPELLRLGSGAYGIALLKNVPVWYELWRNLNGFPPDFYITEPKVAEKK